MDREVLVCKKRNISTWYVVRNQMADVIAKPC